MNSRGRKRQICARYRRRGKFWLTAEDRAWLNVVPIGREFGSKDFERLSILDAFTQGRIDEQRAMSLLGIDHDALTAMVEKDGLRSQDLQAGSGKENSIFTQEQCEAAVLTWPDWPNESDDDLNLAIPPVPLSPAWGLKDFDTSMKNEFKLLREKYPYMFSGESLGISIARGWMPGFQILCKQIDALLGVDKRGFHWTQCKEKFGSARFYWDMDGDRPSTFKASTISGVGVVETILKSQKTGKPEFSIYEEIDELVEAATNQTQHMCIVCGEPGKGDRTDGYVLILCDQHSRLDRALMPLQIWFDRDEYQ